MKFKLLNSTSDALFKMLLTRYVILLRAMIEAVIDLKLPIDFLVVTNPGIPNDYPADKGIVLNVRVRLGDGSKNRSPRRSDFIRLFTWRRTIPGTFTVVPLFTGRTVQELEALAIEEPMMATAKQALEEIPSDPTAQGIARERELAIWNMQHMLHASCKEGREEGTKTERRWPDKISTFTSQ